MHPRNVFLSHSSLRAQKKNNGCRFATQFWSNFNNSGTDLNAGPILLKLRHRSKYLSEIFRSETVSSKMDYYFVRIDHNNFIVHRPMGVTNVHNQNYALPPGSKLLVFIPRQKQCNTRISKTGNRGCDINLNVPYFFHMMIIRYPFSSVFQCTQSR